MHPQEKSSGANRPYIDLDLLRSGSAITILCAYYDLWAEEDRVYGHPGNERYQAALDSERFSAFPDVEAVIREALSRGEMSADDPWFDEAVTPIYRKYVRGFFRRLANADRSER